MPKWSSEGLSVVAFLVFKPACWILVIYYIKQGLFQQKLAPLYKKVGAKKSLLDAILVSLVKSVLSLEGCNGCYSTHRF